MLDDWNGLARKIVRKFIKASCERRFGLWMRFFRRGGGEGFCGAGYQFDAERALSFQGFGADRGTNLDIWRGREATR